MVNTINNGEQMHDNDVNSVEVVVKRSLDEITQELRVQYANLVGHINLIDSYIDRSEYNLSPEYQGALLELKRMLRTNSATPEQLEEYITAIVEQIILPQEYKGSQSISRYYTDMYPALRLENVTSFRSIRNVDFSALTIGTLYEVEKDHHVQSDFYVWNGTEGIKVPYTELYFLRQMQPEARLHAAIECEKGERMLNSNQYDSFRIIHTTADVFMDKKDGHMYRDGRELYKYYLIKDLHLPQEQQDKMVYELLSEYLRQYISSWRHGNNSYGSRVGIQEHELRRLAYHLPIQNQRYIQQLQVQFEEFAPELIEHDAGWELQELCATFNVSRSRYKEYAKRAIRDMLNNAEESNTEPRFSRRSIGITNLLRLQETYNVELTEQQVQQAAIALERCVGSRDDFPERFCKAFTIPREVARNSALAEATEALNESIQRNYDPMYEKDIGAHDHVRTIVERYNIMADELPVLNTEVSTLLEALVNKKTTEEYIYNLQSTKLRHYLPQLLESALVRILHSKDWHFFNTVHVILADSAAYAHALTRLFASQNYTMGTLDLSYKECQELWYSLYKSNSRFEKNLAREWLHQIDLIGINSNRMSTTLKHCSHTPKEREQYNKQQEKNGESHRLYEKNDTENVAKRIMETIHAIEQVYPGAAAYFYEEHGICMFNRYPIDVLLQVYEDETGTITPERKAIRKPTKNKGHMLVLYPHTDWNGAFENHEVLNNIQKDAVRQGLTLHIAESGTRTGCLRHLAKTSKQYGALKAAVIGAHADETLIRFGPNDEDILTLEELQNVEAATMTPALQKKLQRMQSFFDPNAVIIFKSCSIGKQHGITHKISNLLKRITIGADRPAALKNITLDLAEAQYAKDTQATTYFPTRIQKWRYAIKRWWKKQ